MNPKQSRRGFFRTLAAVAAGAPLIPTLARHSGRVFGELSKRGIVIPFNTLPTNVYIRGPRYKVMFDRVVTPRRVL